MYLGPKPENMIVMHTCDNRHCVNPAHLKYGTASENMIDMYEKGRANHKPTAGENNGAAKLTEENVRQARKLREETGMSYEKLARMFGITRSVMYDAINRKTWRHVT
jgi:DNA invertase Pin-like site-specific DNA recombinase